MSWLPAASRCSSSPVPRSWVRSARWKGTRCVVRSGVDAIDGVAGDVAVAVALDEVLGVSCWIRSRGQCLLESAALGPVSEERYSGHDGPEGGQGRSNRTQYGAGGCSKHGEYRARGDDERHQDQK